MNTKKLIFGGVIALIFALACVFAFVLSFGLNLNNQVQTAYALDNPISASNVYYFDGYNDVSFGTTMPTGYTFSDGTLTIADGATPYEILTEGAGDLTIDFTSNYNGSSGVAITVANGDLTLTSNSNVNVTLGAVRLQKGGSTLLIKGGVTLNIVGPDNAFLVYANLVYTNDGSIKVKENASVTAKDPNLYGTTSGSFVAIVQTGTLYIDTTGCFKVGLYETLNSTDKTEAIAIEDLLLDQCDGGFELYKNDASGDYIYSTSYDISDHYITNIDFVGSKYTLAVPSIIYNANGGSGLMNNGVGTKGEFHLPSCNFTAPSGKQFKCWAVGSASGTQYNAGANYTITDDVTFYAVWEDAQVQKQDRPAPVGVEAVDCQTAGNNDGQITGVSTEMEYQPDGAMDEWTEIVGNTITGLTPGYYNVRYKETEIYNASEPVQVCVGEYVAPATYTISFDANGGTGTMLDVENQTSPYTLPACAFEKEGWHFLEWAMGSTEGIRYSVSSEAEISENTTFYAIWEQDAPTTYTVTYKPNNEAVGVVRSNISAGAYNLEDNHFAAPEGKKFKAWNVNGTEKEPGDTITISENTIIVAVWEDVEVETTYTVTYKPNNEAVGVVRSNISAGAYNLEDNHFAAPSGKQFKAWNVNGTEKQPGDTITISENTIIVAVWEDVEVETTYTVTYKPNNEADGVVRNDIPAGAYNLEDNHFVAPSGKQFKAWNVNGVEIQPGDSITISDNITIIAVWEDVSHVHTMQAYLANGATCTETGNIAYWYCTGCQKYFSDSEGNTEIELETTIVPATGHDWGDWEITTPAQVGVGGIETRVCSRDVNHTQTREIPALPYEYNTVDGTKVYEYEVAQGQAKDVSGLFAEAKAENGKVELTVGTLKLTFNAAAVNAIGGNTVSLTASVLTENLTIDGAELVVEVSLTGATFADGSVRVEVPFTTAVPEGKVAKVYYVNGSNKEDMNATFADGKVSFDTTHFSTFAVVFENEQTTPADPVNPEPSNPEPSNPEVNPTPEKKGLSGGAIAGIVIAIVVVLAGAGVGCFFLLKKKGVIGKKTDEPKKEDEPKDESNL